MPNEAEHYARVKQNVLFPTPEEALLRSKVRFLKSADNARLRENYLSMIESQRLFENGKQPANLSGCPSWLTTARVCMLALSYPFVGMKEFILSQSTSDLAKATRFIA